MLALSVKRIGTVGIVSLVGLSFGPAQPVAAGEMGASSSASISISVSVAPRAYVAPSTAWARGTSRDEYLVCMLAPSASGLFSIRLDRNSPGNVIEWRDAATSSAIALSADRPETFLARRSLSECLSGARGSSTVTHRPTGPASTSANGGADVLLLAPE